MSTTTKAPDFLVVIPARLGSTRLPRKPLADLDGKPMVVRVAERAKLSNAHSVVVATDSPEILAACDKHRIECLLTSADHPTGTDRIAEVAQLLKLPADALVVNVQGDEPLIPPELINQVAQTLADNSNCAISTVATPITDLTEIDNPNAVKVVLNQPTLPMIHNTASGHLAQTKSKASNKYLWFFRTSMVPTAIYILLSLRIPLSFHDLLLFPSFPLSFPRKRESILSNAHPR